MRFYQHESSSTISLDQALFISHTSLSRYRAVISPRRGSPFALRAEGAMFFAAALLSVLPATRDAYANLDFRAGALDHWQGQGFDLSSATGRGPSLTFAVCSGDCGPKGKKALLHRTFVVPPDTGTILRASPPRRRRLGAMPTRALTLSLRRPSGVLFPKQVHTGERLGGGVANCCRSTTVSRASTSGMSPILLDRLQRHRPGRRR